MTGTEWMARGGITLLYTEERPLDLNPSPAWFEVSGYKDLDSLFREFFSFTGCSQVWVPSLSSMMKSVHPDDELFFMAEFMEQYFRGKLSLLLPRLRQRIRETPVQWVFCSVKVNTPKGLQFKEGRAIECHAQVIGQIKGDRVLLERHPSMEGQVVLLSGS